MERDVDDEEKEDEEEEDEAEDDTDDTDEEEEEEEEDEDEDDGKEPRVVSQGEMVNSSADDVDSVVGDQQIVVPEQGQEMREYTPLPQPLTPVQRHQIPKPRPQLRTPETHPLSGLEELKPWRCRNLTRPCQVCKTLFAAGNTSDVTVYQQLLGESVASNNLPNVRIPNVPLLEVHPEGMVGEEWTSPRVAEEVMVVTFALESGSCFVRFLCSNLLISGLEYYMHHEVFGSLRVYFIHSIMGHHACSILATPGV